MPDGFNLICARREVLMTSVKHPAKTVHIKSFGCQMNVYDSERMRDVLEDQGYVHTDSTSDADLVILNTCHIREKAVEKVYSDIGRLREQEKTRVENRRETLVAVAGCVAQAEGAEIIRRAPTVNLVFGPQTYHRLPAFLEQAHDQIKRGYRAKIIDTEFPAEDKFGVLSEVRRSAGPSAFLTVQEGCDKFCTFCVVPYTRGAETSRPVNQIKAEARQLVSKGAREITLLGQNVNAWHGDANGAVHSLAQLIRQLAKIDGLDRLRFMTSHPRDMDDELIQMFADEPKLMPFMHLPVQSGSNRILKAMNRAHTAESYLATIEKLRKARADIAISGDFIVGFPGETEADFDETLALVRAVNHAQAFSFKYSARPGTPAADIEAQIPEDIKTDRLTRLQALLMQQQTDFNTRCLGRMMPVLLDRTGKLANQFIGRSPYLQPVHIVSPTAQIGDMVQARIVSSTASSLKGELVETPAAVAA
jgi:tRNA-2-methylthio-N6-dimethylallyladenosine synthase